MYVIDWEQAKKHPKYSLLTQYHLKKYKDLLFLDNTSETKDIYGNQYDFSWLHTCFVPVNTGMTAQQYQVLEKIKYLNKRYQERKNYV